MHTAEKVNKPFVLKLLLLFVLLFLGFISKAPPFTKESRAAVIEQSISPADDMKLKQIQQLYYHMISDGQQGSVAI